MGTVFSECSVFVGRTHTDTSSGAYIFVVLILFTIFLSIVNGLAGSTLSRNQADVARINQIEDNLVNVLLYVSLYS